MAPVAAGGSGTGLMLADHFLGEPELRDALTDAVVAHTARSSGRAVIFPGSALLTGTVGMADVLHLQPAVGGALVSLRNTDADALLRRASWYA